MPLPGGPSDKAGNRYELWWTVVCMARVLRGDLDSIRLETPGAEGEGVEFCLRQGNAREYHQVKRQSGRSGQWTLGQLSSAGVLAAFRNHLGDDQAECVFVSSQDAYHLRELTERARDSIDLEEFDREFTKGDWGAKLSKLLEYWPGCNLDEVFSLLKRITVHSICEEMLRLHAELALEPLIDGDTSAASDVLFAYALESVHRELDAARITERLKCRGFDRPIWADPVTLLDVVQKANERYTTRLKRELIRGELIQRDECAHVLRALKEGSGKRGAFVTGGAGSGKSTVLLHVIESLKEQDIPALAFRIDNLTPTQSPDDANAVDLSHSHSIRPSFDPLVYSPLGDPRL